MRLRSRFRKDLSLQFGREVRLLQDTATIARGSLCEDHIRQAIAESAFFVPIVWLRKEPRANLVGIAPFKLTTTAYLTVLRQR